ncbi:hypothetical protein NBRC116594_17200 [Shimia sp. NS0008-38b]|uniref:hypothetical protein n=1 Tax=Shimia sp. NS0008-38b TaxID=3127653 RepID=UPI00310ACE49
MSLDDLRPQYHFRQVGGRMHIWDVRKLLKSAEALPVITVDVSDIRELDESYWFDESLQPATCRAVGDHIKLVHAADLAYPILLCAEGRVMDGMHRVVKAYVAGHATIAARQLHVTPPPDHIDVPADDLPYE